MQLNKSGNKRGMQGQIHIARQTKGSRSLILTKKELAWRRRARENNYRIIQKYC